MTDDGKPVGHGLELWRDFLDQFACALIGLLGAVGKHRASVLVNNLDIETLLGFLEHNVFRRFSDFGHVLQGLPQRGGRKRKFAVLLEAGAVGTLAVVLLRRWRG